jgi:hypothetical protein
METTELPDFVPPADEKTIMQVGMQVADMARVIFCNNVEFGLTATDVATVIKKSFAAAQKFEAYTENYMNYLNAKDK